MRSIFTGFLLVFLNFNLRLNSCTVELIPDFIGYFFIAKGLGELAGEGASFVKARPFAVGMGAYTGVLFGLNLFGASARLGWFGILLGLANIVLSLYLCYRIIEGIREMEAAYGADLNGDKLRLIWRVLAALQIAAGFSVFIPLLVILCALASAAASIVFLVAFNTSKKRYEALTQGDGAEQAK